MGNNYECRFICLLTKISGNTLTCWSACSARPWPISFKMELEEDCLQESQYRRRLFPRTLSLSPSHEHSFSFSTYWYSNTCSRALKHNPKHSHTLTQTPTGSLHTHTHTHTLTLAIHSACGQRHSDQRSTSQLINKVLKRPQHKKTCLALSPSQERFHCGELLLTK